MPQSSRPVQVYSFADFSKRAPTQQQPGDRIDAQFAAHADAIAGVQARIEGLAASLLELRVTPREPTLSSPSLYVGAGGPYAGDDAGATATSADYAQVSIDWAEWMPGTIPGNILAVTAISGDHWSSRWWANRAALLVQAAIAAGLGSGFAAAAEQLTVGSANSLSALSQTPVDALTTMQIVVNGRAFAGCAAPAHFTVTGKQVNWASALYGLAPSDEVIARYQYATSSSSSPPALTSKPAISLYYLAVQGQTSFLLSTPDRFALTYNLRATSKVQVTRGGNRLMPDDGSGKGSYSVSQPGNQVTLLYPAGVDETLIVDVWEPV